MNEKYLEDQFEDIKTRLSQAIINKDEDEIFYCLEDFKQLRGSVLLDPRCGALIARNEEQYQKLLEVAEYFRRWINEDKGDSVEVILEAPDSEGYVMVKTDEWGLFMTGKWKKEYIEMLDKIDFMAMSPEENGKMCINVMVRKVNEVVFPEETN